MITSRTKAETIVTGARKKDRYIIGIRLLVIAVSCVILKAALLSKYLEIVSKGKVSIFDKYFIRILYSTSIIANDVITLTPFWSKRYINNSIITRMKLSFVTRLNKSFPASLIVSCRKYTAAGGHIPIIISSNMSKNNKKWYLFAICHANFKTSHSRRRLSLDNLSKPEE